MYKLPLFEEAIEGDEEEELVEQPDTARRIKHGRLRLAGHGVGMPVER